MHPFTTGADYGKRIYINHLKFHPDEQVVNLKYPRQGHPLNSFTPTANICKMNRFPAWHRQLSVPAMEALRDFAHLSPRAFKKKYPKYVAGRTVGVDENALAFVGGTIVSNLIMVAVLYFVIRWAVAGGLRDAQRAR